MKLPALLLAASLAGNGLLVAVFFARPALAPPAFRDFFTTNADRAAQAVDQSHAIQSRVAARTRADEARANARRAQLWAALTSDDLSTLVARLRAAGFPPAVIRDIIRAEVNARYRDRLMALMGPDPNTPYWREAPSAFSMNSKRYEEVNQLERERAKLLRDLLAGDFFANGDVTADQRRRFGNLTLGKIDAVQRIEDDYAEMFSQVRAAMGGVTLPEDREKLALLAREKQADLAAILSPEEFADYTMRSSAITNLLRSQLATFDPTEKEFRAIFQQQLALNEKFPPNVSGGVFSSGDYEQRRVVQQELEAQVKAALGDARYAEYMRSTNRDFQQLARLAQRDNLPPETAIRTFNLRDDVARESNRIFDDGALTLDQKRAALQTLAQNTRTQITAALGPVSGPAYLKVLDNSWLATVERGSAVSFNAGGGGMTMISNTNGTTAMVSLGGSSPSYRRLQNPTPPPRP